jgi:DNA (cytosine-5)-methyltransferase 1
MLAEVGRLEYDASVPGADPTERPIALDLFCGAGGVTTGFKAAGIHVLGAVDTDAVARKSFKANHPEVKVYGDDLRRLPPKNLRRRLGLRKGELIILTACAPCQTFSTLSAKNRKVRDFRNPLVDRVIDFVEEFEPKAVVMENVPQLLKHWRFVEVVRRLRRLGYAVRYSTLDAADFGVPQRRRRLVLVAVKGVAPGLIPDLTRPSPGSVLRQTVRAALAALGAGVPGDSLNLKRLDYPKTVAERIAAIPSDGGSRTQLPPSLRLKCHEKLGRSGAGNVYGRMRWDDVAPTLTTRCTTPACGRFLHPVENRAITPREAAVLQSFPPGYKFEGTSLEVQAQIGNAVPPLLAQAVATLVLSILAASRGKKQKKQVSLSPRATLLFPTAGSLQASASRPSARVGRARRTNGDGGRRRRTGRRGSRLDRLGRSGLRLDKRIGNARPLGAAP